MASKHMKMWSNSLGIREMQIITLTTMYSPEWLKCKGQKMPNIDEAKEVLELSYSTREGMNQDPHFGKINLTVSPKDEPTSPIMR